jgi:tetratricopeptide (TPR) repeat protein
MAREETRSTGDDSVVAATPALRADVERLASRLDDWWRRYLTRDWQPALTDLRAAHEEAKALFFRLAALSDGAELLSVAAPLGATGFRWATELPAEDRFADTLAFHDLARALQKAAEACGTPEIVRASCGLVAGRSFFCECHAHLAQALLEGALEVRRRLLGASSREALDAQHELGAFHCHQGRYAEAEAAFRAAYDGRKRLLGAGDADTLRSLQCLADSLTEQAGKAAAGEALLRVALQGLEAALGPDHPYALNALYSLGYAAKERGELAAAEGFFRRALDSSASGLGEDHEATCDQREELGSCLMLQGRHAEAEPHLRHLAELWPRTRGAADPFALAAQMNLATCLTRQGKHSGALDVLRPALAAASAELGSTHRSTLTLAEGVIEALVALRSFSEAKALAERTLPRLRAAPNAEVATVRVAAMLRACNDALAQQRPSRGAGRRR